MTLIVMGRRRGSGGANRTRYDLIPTASATMQPDYTALSTLRSAGATTPWTDPYSGLSVYRLRTDAEGDCALAYSNGGPYVSLPDNGQYWVVVGGINVGGVNRIHVVGFTPGSGRTTAPINTGFADNAMGDVAVGWSHVSATTFYRVQNKVLRKYTWNGSTMTEVTGGVWPKDFSAQAPNSTRLSWMTHDTSDRIFTVCAASDDKIMAWDSQTDTLYTVTSTDFAASVPSGTTIDEGYVDHSGRYVMVKLSPLGWLLWDLQNDRWSAAAGHVSHPSLGNGGGVAVGGFSIVSSTTAPMNTGGNVVAEMRPRLTFIPITSDGQSALSMMAALNDGSIYGANATYLSASPAHSSTSHNQTTAAFSEQWSIIGANNGPGLNTGSGVNWSTGWSLTSGAIYQRTWAVGARAVTGAFELSADGTTVNAQPTAAASLGAMVAGTYFVDMGTRTLYMWRSDSTAVTTTNTEPRYSAAVQVGVFAEQWTSPSTVKAVAFTYQHPRQNTYEYSVFASSSPDGRVVVFNTDFGRLSGTRSVCAVALPWGS